MKIKEKTQRRLRNAIITFAVICLTPVFEEGRILSGAHSSNAYAGQELICALDLGDDMYNSNSLETGLNYELLKMFAKDNHCEVRIVAAGKNGNYLDSLRLGRADILITNDKNISEDKDITILSEMTECSSWATNNSNSLGIKQIDNWIGSMKSSREFEGLQARYKRRSNPHKQAENGIFTQSISPYDNIMKKYAKELGWDWRMVAAVVYQESKFSISSRSFRGAQGLMQVMPQTGKYYGVENLLDPEQNIIAGTSHLKRLQRMFSKYELTDDELVKFTLAAYNAGEGRIIDCRNLAAAKGFDNSKWDEIVKVIPLMRDDSILMEESVKLGKFNGYETIDYIESVLSHYNAFCQITSL